MVCQRVTILLPSAHACTQILWRIEDCHGLHSSKRMRVIWQDMLQNMLKIFLMTSFLPKSWSFLECVVTPQCTPVRDQNSCKCLGNFKVIIHSFTLEICYMDCHVKTIFVSKQNSFRFILSKTIQFFRFVLTFIRTFQSNTFCLQHINEMFVFRKVHICTTSVVLQ